MYVVIKDQAGAFSIQDEVVLVIRVSDIAIPSGMTADTLTAAGSMIVAIGAGLPSETGAPGADGLVWVSDLSLAKKGKWAAQSGGGGDITLYNKSGADQVAGTVVIMDSSNDEAFILTTTRQDRRVIGVMSEDIVNNLAGKVAIAGKNVTVRVQGNVSRGMWLIASATSGRAEAAGYTRPPGAIGMALTAYAGGGAGTVKAMISVDHYIGAAAGKGYSIGGNAAGYITTAQVLNLVSETCSIIAGAALTAARNCPATASFSDKGFTWGGFNGGALATADRTTFSTDVTAAVVAANLPAARQSIAGSASSTNGYAAGGNAAAGGGAPQNTAYKMPSSTETTAAQASANLATARQDVDGMNSSTNGYMAGGWNAAVVANCDKLVFATDTTAALASGNLSSARVSAVGLQSTLNGYHSGGSTGAVVNTTEKMPFSTEIAAAVGGAALSSARKHASSVSGLLSGFVLGGSTTAAIELSGALQTNHVATADKLNFSTDVMAAAAGANLVNSAAGQGSLTSPI